jgi:hypothetical protein
VVAFLGFGLTLVVAILIYQGNSEKIENELRGQEHPGYRTVNLAPYDRSAIGGFLVGAVALAVIGVSSAALSANNGRSNVSQTTSQADGPTDRSDRRSLEGIEALRPAPPLPPTAPADGGSETPTTEPSQPKSE